MKKLLLLLFSLSAFFAFSQSTTITSGSQGVVQLPRLSYEQINAIPNPKAGMMVFDSTFKCLKYYTGTKWLCSSQNDNNTNAVGFAWNHKFYGYYGDDRASNIYVDINNNVYISGRLGTGYINPFVAKYSPTGSLLWQYESQAVNYESAPALFTDANNNTFALYTTRWKGYSSLGCYKFLPNGTLDWQTGLSATYSSNKSDVRAENMFLDNNQNIYITGNFYGTITTDAGAINSNDGSSFIAKYSNGGAIQWIKNVPKRVVGVNPNGEAYFAGYFDNSLFFNNSVYYSYGGSDMIFGKLNSSGQPLWLKHIGGPGNDKITDAAIDTNGNLFAIGSFSNSVNFDGNTATAVDSEDFIVIKYNTNGVFQWIRNGGGLGKDEGVNLQISNGNHPVISGIASSNSVSFYPDIIINPATSPSNFLIKYNGENGDITWIKPNEASNQFKVNANGDIYTWSNIGGSEYGYENAVHIFTKYNENGEFAYRQINGGMVTDLAFGLNKHFFFTGSFVKTVQIGASTLICSDEKGDIFISHWME